MILQIEQDNKGAEAIYNIFSKNGRYGEIFVPQKPISLHAEIKLPEKNYLVEADAAKYAKLYGMGESIWFYIIENGNVVGKIYQEFKAIKKVLCFKTGYSYFKVRLYDKEYDAYGYYDEAEGYFFSFYLKDEIIGALEIMKGFHKQTKRYRIYTEDESIISVFVFLMLYVDRSICGNYHSGGYEDSSQLYKTCDELEARYNFEYIKHIREKEEAIWQ